MCVANLVPYPQFIQIEATMSDLTPLTWITCLLYVLPAMEQIKTYARNSALLSHLCHSQDSLSELCTVS